MDVTPLVRQGQQIIQSYTAGTFRISGISYETPVFVFPHETKIWDLKDMNIQNLKVEDFQFLRTQADEIDVVLLGTGASISFLSPALKQKLSAQGLPVDFMDTGAACRTYNVLMAEGRRVVAALLPT